MFELLDRTNYLRAEHLTLLSPESFILLAFGAVFFFFSRRRLIDLFILSLPLTDIIYRVWQLQPTDVIGILLLLTHRRLYFPIRLPLVIIPAFLISSAVGYYVWDSTFSLLYTFRFIIVLASMNCFATYLVNEGPAYYQALYCKAILLSVALQMLQLASWLAGFETPGVFYLEGFPRIKGTAHEPATFALLLALSIPFTLTLTQARDRLHVSVAAGALVAIAVGLFFTLSLTGVIAGFLVALFSGTLLAQYGVGRKVIVVTVLAGFAAVAALRVVSPDAFEYTTGKAIDYYEQMAGETDAQPIDRASDRNLLTYVDEHAVLGIGVFSTVLLTRFTALSATNMYICFLLELGIPLFLFFLGWLSALIAQTLRRLSPESALFAAAFFAWVISLLGLRTFGFYLPWIILAFALVAFRRSSPVGNEAPPALMPTARYS